MTISKKLLRYFDERDPQNEERISQDIKRHRMGWGTICFHNEKGQPISISEDYKIDIRQVTHDFKFGSTLFMLEGFESKEKNADFENYFLQIFNHGIAPFFWNDLEPRDGELRFSAKSEPIYRRPPPDLLVDWANKNNVSLKGHSLVWDRKLFHPEYAPDDHKGIAKRLSRHIKEIAERYGEKIETWDVINEAIGYPNVTMPDDRVFWSFNEANKYFPSDAKLVYNEGTEPSWMYYRPDTSWNFLLLQNLLLRGARVDGAGLQYHHFTSEPEVMNGRTDTLLNPGYLLRVLDQYARLGLTINISEVTIPMFKQLPDGEDLQASLMKELYRVWFSHSNVDGITLWNMVDGTAHTRVDWDQNTLFAGILDEKLKPKASFHALDNLINKEWKTNMQMLGNGGNSIKFQGFYGNYEISLTKDSKRIVKQVHVSKTSPNNFTLTWDNSKSQ